MGRGVPGDGSRALRRLLINYALSSRSICHLERLYAIRVTVMETWEVKRVRRLMASIVSEAGVVIVGAECLHCRWRIILNVQVDRYYVSSFSTLFGVA